MKCPYCTLRQFPSTSALENHMKTQHSWGNFSCPDPHCDFAADFAEDLIEHTERSSHVEDEKTKVECPQCKGGFPAVQLKDHYEECVAKDIPECPVCGKIFEKSNYDKFERHKKRKHFWGAFECSLCRFS